MPRTVGILAHRSLGRLGHNNVRLNSVHPTQSRHSPFFQDLDGIGSKVSDHCFEGCFAELTIESSYPDLVGARIALGITEAGLFPGVVY